MLAPCALALLQQPAPELRPLAHVAAQILVQPVGPLRVGRGDARCEVESIERLPVVLPLERPMAPLVARTLAVPRPTKSIDGVPLKLMKPLSAWTLFTSFGWKLATLAAPP